MDEIATLPVWVSFPGLDLRLWGGDGLSKVASLVGRPIASDRATQDKLITNYAMVLVDMDLSKEFPEKVVFMNMFW